MSMSKKDFIALADHIRNFNECATEDDKFSSLHISELADFCEIQNQRFDRQLWLDYIAGIQRRTQ